ncbi:mRNA interferase toxin YafQ [Commensalibacter sp. Nvir]|uniref:type II toxin-antitoxin system RelE/ParE family toxin n=1 Tax=Commensalibacter sp. Nvir TaxID=3069817 RepID=UPI002D2BD767|nr:mRNA interferase toxin YafQ [Commensalibacter sp. Nvir]
MLASIVSSAFKKDIKRLKKRGKDLSKLHNILTFLVKKEPLPKQYKEHFLIGNWKDYQEAHIEPDWLIIYKIKDNILYLVRTGTHSDLF